MQPLNIYMVQADLAWENCDANLKHISHLISEIPDGSLILLPEMFTTGFTMNPSTNAEGTEGMAIQWLKENSKNRAICGSISFAENGAYYNRLLWAENGEIKAFYNKHHLFSYGKEPRFYQAGEGKICVEYKGWKILPFVCYDLRFPVWCRNTEEAELMLFVANWPQVRIKAWERLLVARAIENQCYVAGVNRVGEDGNGIYHSGNSIVSDPWGEIISKKSEVEGVIHVLLEAEKLMEFRQQFPVLKDMDSFQILSNKGSNSGK